MILGLTVPQYNWAPLHQLCSDPRLTKCLCCKMSCLKNTDFNVKAFDGEGRVEDYITYLAILEISLFIALSSKFPLPLELPLDFFSLLAFLLCLSLYTSTLLPSPLSSYPFGLFPP